MKTLKNAGIIFLIVFCFVACNRPTNSLQILIQNQTEDTIHVRVFPTGGFWGSYPMCFGCDRRLSTTFDLCPNTFGQFGLGSRILFQSDDLRIKPYVLATQAFDSIHVHLAGRILRFTHETVTGYSENLFSENSTWEFKIEEQVYHFQLSSETHRFHTHTFIISDDKIIRD